MSKKYAVVTTVQTFAHRYVISEDRLQSLNTDMPVDLEWADDTVTMEHLEEFSQKCLGEQIIETKWMKEEEVLSLFPEELPYLDKLSKEDKLSFINDGLKLDRTK